MKWISLILVVLLVSSVVATGDRVIYYPLSSTGGGNITYNITYFGGEMNQTPNMTAGLDGSPGINGIDGIMNQTPNMTAANADMTWNLSYYLRDNSRTLTSEKVKRDVDNDLLSLYGGNAIAGGTGGILSLFGKDTVNPYSAEMNAGDGGIANIRVTGWAGGANPRMDMNSYNISSVMDPVALQDAATKNYVDNFPAINGSYYLRDGSLPITDYNVFRDTADEILILHGGTNVVGQGAMLKLYGHGYAGDPGGDIQFTVPNTAGDGDWLVARIKGNTETPYLDLFGNQIKRVQDPTAAQDAATMHYVDDQISMVSPAASLLAADGHIQSNRTAILSAELTNNTAAQYGAILTADQHIGTNVTAITASSISTADSHIATNYTAVLKVSDDHIATNMSTVSAPANLLAADGHIQSNRTAILSAELTNNTAAQAGATLTADQHIATNMSTVSAPTMLLAADQHILSNLTTSDQHIESNKSIILLAEVKNNTAYLRSADDHILSNLTVADQHIASNRTSYALIQIALSLAAPADFTTYWYGALPIVPTTTVGVNKMYFPKTGTIKAVEIFGYCTTAGSAEGWEMSLVNATSSTNSTLISKVTTSATTRRWTNTTMLKPATAGDYIEVRTLCPGWVTNPLACSFSGSIYIE